MKYAEPYHETLLRSWNSSVILGMAVPMIVWQVTVSLPFGCEKLCQRTLSSDTKNMPSIRDTAKTVNRVPCKYSSSGMGASSSGLTTSTGSSFSFGILRYAVRWLLKFSVICLW
jgi:hypothetical protein